MEPKNNKVNGKMNNSVVVVGVIGLIVGLLIGWLVGRGNMSPATESIDNPATTTEEGETLGEESTNENEGEEIMEETNGGEIVSADFTVGDQNAGNTVVVEGVSTNGVTWVAVRDSVNGKVGNILGAKRVEAGNDQRVEVKLLRPTKANTDYFVVLFRDNGDKSFNSKTDIQVMEDGQVVAESFKTN